MTDEERAKLVDNLRDMPVWPMKEAADQIEADGQRIAELEERYRELGNASYSLVADLAQKLGHKEVELDAALADLNSANRRIAELEAALAKYDALHTSIGVRAALGDKQ